MSSENYQRHQSNLCFKHWRNYEKKGGLKFLTSLLTLAPYACLLNTSFKSTWHRTDRTTVTRAFTSWICFSKSSTLSFTRSILFNITTSCYKRRCHNVVVIWILDLWILTAAARINKRKLHLQILEVKIPKNKPWYYNNNKRETKDKLPQMQFDEMLQGMRKRFYAHQSEPWNFLHQWPVDR